MWLEWYHDVCFSAGVAGLDCLFNLTKPVGALLVVLCRVVVNWHNVCVTINLVGGDENWSYRMEPGRSLLNEIHIVQTLSPITVSRQPLCDYKPCTSTRRAE